MQLDPITPIRPAPEEFISQIKQVLEHFYDFPLLNKHSLARMNPTARLRPGETDGQRLRRTFLAAIEELKPDSHAAHKSVESRFYNLINLRYIESDTMQHVAHELGISERQAYRDLKRAEESLAEVLWGYFERVETGTPLVESVEPPAQEEIDESLVLQLRPVLAEELLKNAIKAVEPLAGQEQVEIFLDIREPSPVFSTDPRLAQQVLINLFSQILQHPSTRTLRIGLVERAGQVYCHFYVQYSEDSPGLKLDQPFIRQFIQQLNWRLDPGEVSPDGWQVLRLEVGVKQPVLLVIDDHPPLIELLRRYLTQSHCQVVGISHPQEGLELAVKLSPDLVLLDVMMPEIDGWEVLQRLRNSPQTAHIPVVICSIFNDPKLAYSLGAAALLPKPVKREQLFEVLRHLKIIT